MPRWPYVSGFVLTHGGILSKGGGPANFNARAEMRFARNELIIARQFSQPQSSIILSYGYLYCWARLWLCEVVAAAAWRRSWSHSLALRAWQYSSGACAKTRPQSSRTSQSFTKKAKGAGGKPKSISKSHPLQPKDTVVTE